MGEHFKGTIKQMIGGSFWAHPDSLTLPEIDRPFIGKPPCEAPIESRVRIEQEMLLAYERLRDAPHRAAN